MKRVKTLFALVLVVALIGTLLVGCGTSDNAGSTEKSTTKGVTAAKQETSAGKSAENPFKKHMEISVAHWDIETALSDVDNDPVYKTIADKLNITINPMAITWDDYTQKIQLWASSESLPDVFSIDAVGSQYYRNWISQGIVKPLPKDLNKYPNLKNYMTGADIEGLAENGVFYCVPRKTYTSLKYNAVDRLVIYRWDLAQKAGITKEPETWDEFKAMLKAVIEKDPEGKNIVGLTSARSKIIDGFFWLYSNPAATSDGSGVDFKWIKEDGKYVPAALSKNALYSLKNMREMYEQGLVDKDIALIKGDMGYDKFASGEAAALLMAGGFKNLSRKVYGERWKKLYNESDEEFMKKVKVLKPLKAKDGKRYHPVFKTYWSESYFNGKLSDEKMDRIMRLYDYMVSPEGVELLTYGIKGADYKKDGDKITILINGPLQDKYKSFLSLNTLVMWNESAQYDMNNPTIGYKAIRKAGVDFMDWVKKNSVTPDFNIALTYMSTPTKDKFTIFSDNDLIEVMLKDEPVEDAWDNILKGYKAKGLEKMIDEVNQKAKEMGID